MRGALFRAAGGLGLYEICVKGEGAGVSGDGVECDAVIDVKVAEVGVQVLGGDVEVVLVVLVVLGGGLEGKEGRGRELRDGPEEEVKGSA